MRALLAVALVSSAGVVTAAPVTRLASPKWTGVNLPSDLADFYADEVARVLRRGGLSVVTAKEMALMLGLERQKELLGCADGGSSCAAELGAALGCDGILTANLAKLGGSYRGALKVVSSHDGRTLAEEAVEAAGERELADALEAAAVRLARTLNPPTPVNLRRWSWVPLAGGVAAGAGAAVGLGIAGTRYADIPRQPTEADGVARAREGRTAEAAGWAAAGVAVAALAGAAVMYLFGAPPEVTPQASVSPAGASFGVVGRLP